VIGGQNGHFSASKQALPSVRWPQAAIIFERSGGQGAAPQAAAPVPYGFSRAKISAELLTIRKSTIIGVVMHKVRSEITGSVWKVEVAVGQSVSEGDTLVIVESMKMEIPISAPASGVVTEILIAEGEPVADDQVVVHLD
jgi:acetyl-CoA carboxylase biotin carboxyl carrier protein